MPDSTPPHDAHCHCGAVRIRIAAQPEFMNECNCSLCRKSGGVWGYYDPKDVHIDGKTSAYERADYPEPAVRIQFCPTCGVTTHWTLTDSFAEKNPDEANRMGVNMRIFGDTAKSGVELRFPDGKNWDGKEDYGYYREAEVYRA